MNLMTRLNWHRMILGGSLGFALLCTGTYAQDPVPPPVDTTQPKPQDEGTAPEKKPVDKTHFPSMDEVLSPHGGGNQDPQARIRELFGEVEENLHQVDRLLSDAAAGDTARLQEVTEAGIGKLLQNSVDRGRKAQQQIQEIIRLAQQAGQKQPGSGKSDDCGEGDGEGDPSNPGKGSSSLDRGEQRQSKEQTPEMGGDQPQGEQPGEQDGESPGEKPGDKPHGEQPGGAQPKDAGKEDNSLGENREGNDPAEGAAERARRDAQARDGWGDLPSHVKDTFRSQGRSELPVRYRDWIDEYYRKLNRKGDR